MDIFSIFSETFNFFMSIQIRIKEIREKLGYTRSKFSELLCVDNSQYSKMERGEQKPTLQMILDICSNFNIDPNWLLFDGKVESQTLKSDQGIEKEEQNVILELRQDKEDLRKAKRYAEELIEKLKEENTALLSQLKKENKKKIANGPLNR